MREIAKVVCKKVRELQLVRWKERDVKCGLLCVCVCERGGGKRGREKTNSN